MKGIEVGKAYHVTIKPDGSKTSGLLGDGCMVRKIIHANIYTMHDAETVAQFNELLADLRQSNPGYTFGYRVVKGW